MLETPPRHYQRLHQKIAALESLKIVFGDFESYDIYPCAVDSVHFITGKFVQMCSCFLVDSL
jgi:hypothetical protein